MGFLDKAKAAATDLAAKADTALTQASAGLGSGGEAERLLRDYGLLTWREQQGQRVETTESARVREGLQRLEHEGRLRDLQLQTTPVAPPPPPGGYQAPPAPGGQVQPGQYAGGTGSADPSGPTGPTNPGSSNPGSTGGSVPPPPPPPPGF